MRTVPAAITAARQSSSSRICKIWRIERTDGVVLRFTEHDRDRTVGAETFLSTASFDASAIKASADFAVDDLDVQGAFDSSYITAEDLLAGRYWGASFYVAEALWDDTAAGMDVLRFGWLGRITETGGKFVAELLGPTVKLQQPILRTYAVACDAELGDARCGVNLALYTQSGTVTAAADQRNFSASGLSLEGDATYFDFGRVTWTTGLNAGLRMEVQTSNGTDVELFLPMPFAIAAGDTFTISAGCNKTLGACINKFNNLANHRGHPHVPVSDDLIKGPVRGQEQSATTDPSVSGIVLDEGGGL